MIKRYVFYIIWVLVVIILIVYSINFKGGDDAMVAQVESQVTAISFQKPILVRKIHVSPGQVVDSGDLLLEVERPNLALILEKTISEKLQIENRIREASERYATSLKILQTDIARKRTMLVSEKNELEYKLDIENAQKLLMDSVSRLTFLTNNDIQFTRLKLIGDQLKSLDSEFELEKARLYNTYDNDLYYFNLQLTILHKEIQELETEQLNLMIRAEKPSTIGNLFVQLNELVPPYQTLLSIYDLNPTLIKAFVHERGVKELQIGSKVIVESVHREYRVEGQIIEIGSRVTAFPEKINPLVNQKSYGQEIFINIPTNNNFLNGEKVYVYIIEDETNM